MRFTSVAVAMALNLTVLAGARALAEEGGGTAEAAGESDVFSTDAQQPMELVAPVGMQEIGVKEPPWVTPMAPLPPAVLCGAMGMVTAAWMSRRVKRRGFN